MGVWASERVSGRASEGMDGYHMGVGKGIAFKVHVGRADRPAPSSLGVCKTF